jgi:hypothetical protein
LDSPTLEGPAVPEIHSCKGLWAWIEEVEVEVEEGRDLMALEIRIPLGIWIT